MDAESRTRDEWLTLRCQSGEAGAFEDLLAAMERPLLYYATKLLGNQEAALDVLQDVWIRVFGNIRRLKDPGSLRPWLYRLIHGVAVDRIRVSASRRRAEDGHAEMFQEADEPWFTQADADAIHEALDKLELRHREVLVLHFLEDFSIAEIAEVIDCPEGTVKSRIYHAKKEMKGILTRGGYGT
jgi:RNA polymerase sigma-70 factor (ECF subfamily)